VFAEALTTKGELQVLEVSNTVKSSGQIDLELDACVSRLKDCIKVGGTRYRSVTRIAHLQRDIIPSNEILLLNANRLIPKVAKARWFDLSPYRTAISAALRSAGAMTADSVLSLGDDRPTEQALYEAAGITGAMRGNWSIDLDARPFSKNSLFSVM
jgi:hypothetical protein